jgi:hypothetical protein
MDITERESIILYIDGIRWNRKRTKTYYYIIR